MHVARNRRADVDALQLIFRGSALLDQLADPRVGLAQILADLRSHVLRQLQGAVVAETGCFKRLSSCPCILDAKFFGSLIWATTIEVAAHDLNSLMIAIVVMLWHEFGMRVP